MLKASFLRTAFLRTAGAIGFAGLLALGACDKGPDQAEVAAQLKKDVEAQLQIMEGGSTPKVITHTGVAVAPASDKSYLVSIEGVKVQPDPEGYLDVGTISYVVTPQDEKTYEISDLKLPAEIPFKQPDGKQQGKLAITTKAFKGVYSKELGVLTALDGEFADIVATDDKGGDLRLAGLKVSGATTDKGGDLFDSASAVTLTGLSVKETGTDGLFAIKEIVAAGNFDAIRMKDYQAAFKKYQELVAKYAAAANASGAANTTGGQPPALTPEEQKALTDAVTAMAASFNGGDVSVALNGMGYTEGGQSPFALDQVRLASAFTGINQEKANLSFDVSHQGLVVNSPEASGALAKGILPKTGNLGIKVTDVPSKELVKVLADNLPGMMSADSTMAEANAMAMLVALQAVLQTSGAKIEVTPSALTADVTEVKADGNFNVSPQAMMGIAGALNIAWTGLDEVMALAQANPAEPDAMNVSSMVGMLLSMAKREPGVDGKPVDKFLIEVKETGEFTVNGNPM
jgi:hypothetical protein